MSQRSRVRSRKKGNFITDYFQWHREYLDSLTTGQKIRYRLLQAAVVISIAIILITLGVKQFVTLPEVPTATTDRFQTVPSIDITGMVGGTGTDEVVVSPLVEGLYFDGAIYPEVVDSGRRDGVYTFLVMGVDDVSNSTDTMLLVTYDTVTKSIDVLSLLRDTMVNNSASVKKLTHVYAYNRGSVKETQVQNGTEAVKLHVSRLTGILPDFYVLLEWEAVGQLVDAVGGVWFDVPYDMVYDDPYQNLHINQKAGYRLLTGDDAMEVVRHRQNNNGWNVGDVGRVSVQQDFLKAVAQTVLTTNILKNAPALSEVFFNNVTTDLTIGNLLAFAQLAVGINVGEDVNFHSTPYYDLGYWNGASYVGVSQNAMVELVNQGLNPYKNAIKSTDLQLIYSTGSGTFGVTNGVLADSRLSAGSSSSSSSSSSSTTTEESSSSSDSSDSSTSGSTSSGSTSSGSSSGNDTGMDIERPDTSTGSSSGSTSSGSSSSGSTSGSTGSGSSSSGSTGSDSSSSGSTGSDSSSSGSTGSDSSSSGSTGSDSSSSGSTGSDSSSSGSTGSGDVVFTPPVTTPSDTSGNEGSSSEGAGNDSGMVILPAPDTTPTTPEPTPEAVPEVLPEAAG